MVGGAGGDGGLHGVVDGEDGFFGDVGAGLADLAGVVGFGGEFRVFAFDVSLNSSMSWVLFCILRFRRYRWMNDLQIVPCLYNLSNTVV